MHPQMLLIYNAFNRLLLQSQIFSVLKSEQTLSTKEQILMKYKYRIISLGSWISHFNLGSNIQALRLNQLSFYTKHYYLGKPESRVVLHVKLSL